MWIVAGENRIISASQHCRVLAADGPDPAAHLLKFADPLVDTSLGSPQQHRQVRSDRLVGTIEVQPGELLDLLDRQAQGAQIADHLSAPQR